MEILGADGEAETLEGTPIHPIWSLDREDWVPLGELVEGERLQGKDGTATVLSIDIHNLSMPVYNIEVHGEHVYEVGELGLLVHNSCEEFLKQWSNGSFSTVLRNVEYHFAKQGASVRAANIDDYMRKAIAAMNQRKGGGKAVEGVTEFVRRIDVHGTNRYVDVDTARNLVVSFGVRL